MTAQSDVRAAPTPRQRRDRIHLSGMEPERQWSANQDGRHDVAVLPVDPRRVPLDLEIVVPVYNEAPHIVERVTELRRFLDESFPFRTVVTVVDNASTDDTHALATQMAARIPGVAVMHLARKGRGLALRSAWSTSSAPVVAYMDVDLSTSLSALLPLVAPLISGHGDVAIGSRLARGAQVVRGPKRELISRTYNLLLRLCLRGRFSDAQCGFKALRADVARELLPLVQDDEWFFDTELLITAERLGMRITEVAVDWVDDPDSRVQIVDTAIRDLRGVWRMSHGVARRLSDGDGARHSTPHEVTAEPLLRFAGVGVISTLGYLGLLLTLRPGIGIVGANAIALALCTLLNTTVHKELTRKMHGFSAKTRFSVIVSGLWVISVALTTAALAGAQVVLPDSLALALVAVTAANALASVIRFAILRAWIFRPWPTGLGAS
jgi:putative flippase GtrA